MAFFFNKTILDDLYRYEGRQSTRLIVQLRYLIGVPGFAYIFFFRHASMAKNRFAKCFWLFFLHITKIITHIQIPVGTVIGKGFRISHFGHIVINPKTIIGNNFNISQGCLIGYSEGKQKGVPIIGNNVCMNANSIVIGGCVIGDNVLIAPGAFVNFDVPSNSVVIGNPGSIKTQNESPTRKYIIYPV